MHKEISRLKSVDLQGIWKTEPGHFTPWLAEEENLSFLARTLNMEFELEAQEIDIGDFRADLVCRNTVDGSRVLIENQLDKTNHKHLGQILTYAAGLEAAGLEAATIIWIAKKFRDGHRAALDWLNRITGEDLRFFGVEIELLQIGDSLPAPKFNIVSKPVRGGAVTYEGATLKPEIIDGEEVLVARGNKEIGGLWEYWHSQGTQPDTLLKKRMRAKGWNAKKSDATGIWTISISRSHLKAWIAQESEGERTTETPA